MRNTLLFILFTLCLGACSPGHNDYSDFKNISPEGWAYADTLNFKVDIDTTSTGNLSLALRHDNNYGYSNLWIEVSHRIDSTTVDRDTLNITLADIYGRWNGKGIGTSFQAEAVVSPDYKLNAGDSIQVRHIMRVDTLEGISQIGLLFISNDTLDE